MRTSDELTVLVFKDHLSSRTFQVPLRWISRLGISLAAGALLVIIAGFLAAKYYRISSKANPVRVLDLEQELSELRAAYKNLEASKTVLPAAPAAPVAAVAQPPAATPAPATPPPVATAPVAVPINNVLFSALPASTSDVSAQAASLPITMSVPRASWRGKTVKVDFNLQYTRTDKGSQQGRIVILARGPETVLSYPEGAFAPVGAPSLVLPEHGEYFSVSRFREVNAEFGPLRSTNSIQEIEILLFNKEGKLIVYQRVKPAPPAVRRATPAAPATGEPADPAVLPPSVPPGVPAGVAPPKAASDAAEGGFIEPGIDR